MKGINILIPKEYKGETGILTIAHEEEALCWLWAFPELLEWENSILWLYTPVVGNKKWPGDLWGIDNKGNLIIVECKQRRRSDDPFVDFVNYHKDNRDELSSEHWKNKFISHLESELSHRDITETRPRNRTDGLVPRSNKRTHIKRWPELAEIIKKNIRSNKYKADALRYLETRRINKNPRPFYGALMVLNKEGQKSLSDKMKRSKNTLEEIVGRNNVFVITIYAKRLKDGRAIIYSESYTDKY